jgi:predicted anti-sigma-YlaC factor YlaD
MSPSRGQLCDRARQWASLRLDGELSELESALLDSHLARCDACRAFSVEAAGIAAALRGVAMERIEEPLVVLPVVHRAPRVRALQAAVAVGLVLVAAALGSVLGVAHRSTSTSTASAHRHTAMIASVDSADELRRLRRPALIGASHPVPRHLLMPGEAV